MRSWRARCLVGVVGVRGLFVCCGLALGAVYWKTLCIPPLMPNWGV